MSDVDTDQIIPARFLHRSRDAGYGALLFHDLRRSRPDSFAAALDAAGPPSGSAKVLVAGRNFGCGSSREAAAYALADAGFRAVVAASFGSIFLGNAVRNGLVPAQLEMAEIEAIWEALGSQPNLTIDLDLIECKAVFDRRELRFLIEPSGRQRLIHGIDDISLSLSTPGTLDEFEARHWSSMPWLRHGATTTRKSK